MENAMESDVTVPQEKVSQEPGKFGKDALLVAGAVLLASLIIAGSIVGGTKKLSSTAQAPSAAEATPSDKAAQQPAKVTVTQEQVKALFTDKNIMFGKKDSKVLFVEFSDPSCPYCHVAAGKNPTLSKQMGQQFTLVKDGGAYVPPVPEMKKMVDEGKAGFVWLYANGHGNGEMGTKALYCAKEKGKFWEAHDLLMTDAGYTLMNNTVKNDKAQAGALADFLKTATNANEMKTCLESGKYDNRMVDDMAIAKQFGFQGTPSFFVNTDNFSGAYSFKDIQSTVDKYLK